MHGVILLEKEKTFKGQEESWVKKHNKQQIWRAARYRWLFPPTGMRGWKYEEARVPGNICGTSWKLREAPMCLLNPQVFTGSLATCWSLSQKEPATCPQRIILNTSEIMKEKEFREQYYSLPPIVFVSCFYMNSITVSVLLVKSNHFWKEAETRNYK